MDDGRPLEHASRPTPADVTPVAAVIAIVLAFVLVGFGVFRTPQQPSAQTSVRQTIILERAWHREHGTFTSLASDIRSLDPSWVPFSLPDNADRPLAFVDPRSAGQRVCLSSLDTDGVWWSVMEDAASGTWYGRGLPFPCDASLAITYARGGWD